MLDFHSQEMLREIKDLVDSRLEDLSGLDDDDRLLAYEELVQEVLDKISPAIEDDE